MKILLTGANGFFGTEIRNQLSDHQLTTIGLSDCDMNIDISTSIPTILSRFEMVIHAAGKAHVNPKTKEDEQAFYDVNVKGTINLLKSFEQTGLLPKTIVFISTVAVYGLDEGIDIKESTPVKPTSAYGFTKSQAEVLLQEWGMKHSVNVVILRLPLLVGFTARGTLGSMINGIRRGYYLRIGTGSVKKSMVIAEDVARFLPNLMNANGIYHLTDGYHPSLKELDEIIAYSMERKVKKIPDWIARLVARMGDIIPGFPLNSIKYSKLSMPLTFNDDKARKELNWKSRTVLLYFK